MGRLWKWHWLWPYASFWHHHSQNAWKGLVWRIWLCQDNDVPIRGFCHIGIRIFIDKVCRRKQGKAKGRYRQHCQSIDRHHNGSQCINRPAADSLCHSPIHISQCPIIGLDISGVRTAHHCPCYQHNPIWHPCRIRRLQAYSL